MNPPPEVVDPDPAAWLRELKTADTVATIYLLCLRASAAVKTNSAWQPEYEKLQTKAALKLDQIIPRK